MVVLHFNANLERPGFEIHLKLPYTMLPWYDYGFGAER
ncbi:MAG: hypothetical protein OJF59_000358 [Cytophagales bacterium]|nr:MAG: hypothetical protein OJF59_000358 [Cytophagales bacterium]